nr:MAG TPA: hypothetical protein [Caudoviricetes sp.]
MLHLLVRILPPCSLIVNIFLSKLEKMLTLELLRIIIKASDSRR